MSKFTRRSALGAALAPAVARAQAWPTRPISWIVPFTPGGITDTSSRLVAQPLGALLGQQVVVENRPGAGGGIGTEAAARAAPDGYTMLYGTQGTMATNPVLYRNIRYEAMRDFVPVHGLTLTPLLLVANPDRPFKDVASLIAYAKARPGEVTYSSSGIGTGCICRPSCSSSRPGFTHVPYQGSAPGLNDLVAGRTDIMFDYLVATRAFLEAGRLRPLATTGGTRLAALPEVPTMAEAGLSGAQNSSWSAIMLQAATPAPIVNKMAEALSKVLAEPRVAQTLMGTGSMPLMRMGEPLRTFVAEEVVRWRAVVERSGARVG
ncbi:Bug family tripartite tricarboxylate transporter substrate binding protein [Siccirubricoccus deserti]